MLALSAGSQFLDPDGMFPNHIPNPEDKQAMASAKQAVERHKPNLGVVFDTDVDRSAVVAANGEPINSNRYIALMAAVTLRYAFRVHIDACRGSVSCHMTDQICNL